MKLGKQCSALLFAILLARTTLGAEATPGIYEEALSTNPAVFNTEDPAAYGRDFPFIPENDPMSGMPRDEPLNMQNLYLPDTLIELQSNQIMSPPPKTPGDYDPEAPAKEASLATEQPIQTSFGNPVFDKRGQLLGSRVRPVFYSVSFITEMEAVGVDHTLPRIPSPLINFGSNPATRMNLGPFRTAVDLTVSTAYNDNVFGTQSDPQGDIIYSFRPRIFLETGTRGLFGITYAPAFTYYAKNQDQNSANQLYSMVFRYPFSKLTIGGEFFYTTEKGLFIASDGPAQSNSVLANLYANYAIAPKSSLAVLGQVNLIDNSPGGKKTEILGTTEYTYQWSGSTAIGSSLTIGNVNSIADEEAYVAIRLKGSYLPSYHYEFLGDFGFQARDLSVPAGGQNQIVTPVFDFTARYHPTFNSSVILRASRGLDSNTFGNVNLNIQTSVEASVLIELSRKYRIRFALESGQVEQLSNTDPERGKFNYFKGGVTLSYSIMNWVDFSVFSNQQRRFASSDGADYTSTISGIAISFKY